MVLGVGTDMLEVARMARELDREGGGFRDDVFTEAEVAYCDGKRYPARHFAARFAAKEALFKALGTGGPGAASWRDVEVKNGPMGEPLLILHGTVKQIAGEHGVKQVRVSLSHTDDLAMAYCLLES